MTTPRHGQWVKFHVPAEAPVLAERKKQMVRRDLPDLFIPLLTRSHRTRDGRIVGVYQRATTDSQGVSWPDHVVPVKKQSGKNLRWIDEDDPSAARLLCYHAADVTDLAPVTDRAEIPADRRMATRS